MNIIAAIEAAAKTLFAKTETDIKSEIASPNWADLSFLALVGLVLLLMYNPVKQLVQPADLTILAGVLKVWMVCHAAKWIATGLFNTWRAVTGHTNATNQAIATAPVPTTTIPAPAAPPAK